MGQLITDIAYMVIGIGVMSMVVLVGIIGIVKVLRNIKDKE